MLTSTSHGSCYSPFSVGSRGCKLRGKFGVTAGSIGMVLQFMNMSSIYWGKYRAEYELIILVESFGP